MNRICLLSFLLLGCSRPVAVPIAFTVGRSHCFSRDFGRGNWSRSPLLHPAIIERSPDETEKKVAHAAYRRKDGKIHASDNDPSWTHRQLLHCGSTDSEVILPMKPIEPG